VTTPPKPETADAVTTPPEVVEAPVEGVEGQHLSDDQRVKLCGILGLADDAPESHVLAAVALEILGAQEEDADEGPQIEVVMRIHISGTRNGQEWPPVGERISLPVAEAAEYVQCGYAYLPDDATDD
jgi:hypothetical protein